MADWIARMAERWMKQAEASGKLSGLEGEGKPLPDRTGDTFVDPGLAAGFRIMAQAGALPEEITLNKAIAAQKAHLATLTAPDDRRAAMAVLADLTQKHAMAQDARRKFLRN